MSRPVTSRALGLHVLDEQHVPVPVRDFAEWGGFMADPRRRVGRTRVGPWLVSTVFLGIDHGVRGFTGPQWFETMVFGPEGRQSQQRWRYATWDEAVAGHQAAVTLLRSEVYP